ncbi:chloride channel protein [Metallumcola ferriviriculae]|uniref:Chloride channel protein n=1 Tax=Metallumcola ferriviriculae TaxID=3039180 RepID=A0AAU0UPS4_9FIRM|nr:chloride channel protein [Desulfitibacteraceae bacterium MK1]
MGDSKDKAQEQNPSTDSFNETVVETSQNLWHAFQTKHPLVETYTIVLFAILIGIIGGLGAIVFRYLIDFFRTLFGQGLGSSFTIFGAYGTYLKALLPAIGLVLVGIISNYFAKEVKGHGVPQILEALALRGGKIKPKVSFFGILAPAITIGSGGSVGQEGPIALIGASFGSVMGQVLKLPEKYISLFLACGASAGIAATFNAPIAGAFFGLEVVLGTYSLGSIVPIFIASVTGTVIFRQFMGSAPVLATPGYTVTHPTEILLMILLGIIAGFVGLAYTRGLTFSEDLFDDWEVPFWLKAIVGGIGVGILGLLFPQVLGVGYSTMETAVLGNIPLLSLILFFIFKFLATMLTIGAGGSGGVFAPSLYLGIMLGGIYGIAVSNLFPNLVSTPWIYTVIGMGAIFAASAQAPLTASTIILEITGDFHIAVGVMAATALSYLIHGSTIRDSMYTVKLTKRGIDILRGTDVRPTERIPVKLAMRPLEYAVYADDSIHKATRVLLQYEADLLVVLNRKEELVGILTQSNVRGATELQDQNITIRDIVQVNVKSIVANDNLEEAMRLFSFFHVKTLPVVDQDNHRKVVGILKHADVINAYSTRILHSMEATAKVTNYTENRDAQQKGGFRSFIVCESSPLADKCLCDITLPEEVVIVSIMRKGEVIIPHGYTIIKPYDTVLVFAVPARKLAGLHKLFAT